MLLLLVPSLAVPGSTFARRNRSSFSRKKSFPRENHLYGFFSLLYLLLQYLKDLKNPLRLKYFADKSWMFCSYRYKFGPYWTTRMLFIVTISVRKPEANVFPYFIFYGLIWFIWSWISKERKELRGMLESIYH